MTIPYTIQCFILIMWIIYGCRGSKTYRDYVMLKITPKNSEASIGTKLVQEIKNNTSCQFINDLLRTAFILCKRQDVVSLSKILPNYDVTVELTSENVEQEINRDTMFRSLPSEIFDHEAYLSVSCTYTWLKQLTENNSEFMKMSVIGSSHENRNIVLIDISNDFTNKSKPIIFIEAGAHAREWIAPAVALFLIHELMKTMKNVESNEPDYDLKKYLRNYRWQIVPLINPDGYHFTRVGDRFWSKNRRPSPSTHPECYGVNLNRNFPAGHGFGPKDPCDRSYIGKEPLSEPETLAVAQYVWKHIRGKTILSLALHSFGQLIFLPYAYGTPEIHPYARKMEKMLNDATHYMMPNYYQFGTVKQFLRYDDDGVGGTSMDFYNEIGIPFSYTIELPDLGHNGMLLPASNIPIVGNEVLTGLERMAAMLSENANLLNLTSPVRTPSWIHYITKSLPIARSNFASLSLNNCCKRVSLESHFNHSREITSSFGIYRQEVYDRYSDDRYIYKKESKNNQEDSTRYLYYNLNFTIWVIEKEVDQKFSKIFHMKDSICPEDLQGNWYYFDTMWNNRDDTLKIRCVN